MELEVCYAKMAVSQFERERKFMNIVTCKHKYFRSRDIDLALLVLSFFRLQRTISSEIRRLR